MRGQVIQIEPDNKTLLEGLRLQGIALEAPCGGKGLCGKCKVRILSGEVSPVTPEERRFLTPEEQEKGVRLACLARALTSVELDTLGLTENKGSQLLQDGYLPPLDWSPMLSTQQITPEHPTLENQLTLWDCVARSLEYKNLSPSLSLLQKLPNLWGNAELTAVFCDDKLIDLTTKQEIYALAIDIGTTTVVCSLMDMTHCAALTGTAFINPQKAYGLDVLSRIHYDVENSGGVVELQRILVEQLNKNIAFFETEQGISRKQIYASVLAGNATMIHALLGIPLSSLGHSPYASVCRQALTVPAADLGLDLAPSAIVYTIPAVSSYIGGDIVAGAMVADLDKAQDNVLFLDIGTNGEMVLSQAGKLLACSCAAGPALEGMNISCGMRAESGAVEGVTHEGDGLKLTVIGGGVPKGLCGSGILEAVSVGLKLGAIDVNGRLKRSHPLVKADEKGKLKFVLAPNICLTQKDIRQVQLCKGAILSGILAMLKHAGLKEQEIDRVLVAGQFGKHLSPESLTGAGLIPVNLRDKIQYIGNSSKMGAVACLYSKERRKQAEAIATHVDYLELSTLNDFEALFVKALSFQAQA